MPSALLIDDEPGARATLQVLLGAHPTVRIAGEAGDLRSAQARLATPDYDLVFLDTYLIGGSGFDLVPHVRPAARIIFVTAFDQHSLRAFEVNALDYLLKPLTPPRLAEALRRVPADAATSAQPTPPRPSPEDMTFLKTGQGAGRFVALSDIVFIKAADNYTEVNLASRERVLVRRTLAGWEEILPPTHFMRVHRHTIAALSHVNGFAHTDRETTQLTVTSLRRPLRARRENWPELSARLVALHGNRFVVE